MSNSIYGSNTNYYDYFPVANYEIIEKKECQTYGMVPTPFMAYGVKTGNIYDLEGHVIGDIIKWMTEKQYNYLISYGEEEING